MNIINLIQKANSFYKIYITNYEDLYMDFLEKTWTVWTARFYFSKMAPTNFPGRPAAKCSAKKRRISAKKLQFKPEKLLVIERTAAFLNDFYNVFGESDDEEVNSSFL